MKFEVKNRFTGNVQFTADIACGEDEPISIKLGLAVRWAYNAGADLAGANLAGADLAGANLARAYLAGADLAGADLAGADLGGAYLAGADLAGAYLAGAVKVDPSEIPVIPNIDSVILSHIEAGGVLDMGSWHGPDNHWCGTTHCRAGWAIHLGGEKGKALQDRVGEQMAGTLIYLASRPDKPPPWFYDSTDGALADLRECAKTENA